MQVFWRGKKHFAGYRIFKIISFLDFKVETLHQHLRPWPGWFHSFICDFDATLLKECGHMWPEATAGCGLSCQYSYATWIYTHLAFEPPDCNSGPKQRQRVEARFIFHSVFWMRVSGSFMISIPKWEYHLHSGNWQMTPHDLWGEPQVIS